MGNFWILPTPAEHWEQVKSHNIYAFQREVDRDKVKPGDKAVFYLMRSDPPVLVGAYEIAKPWEQAKEQFWAQERAEGKVIWPWRFQLNQLGLGAVDARKLSKQLSFVENKEAWPPYFMGSIANFGRPIPERDYQLILDELAKPPVTYSLKPPYKSKTPKVPGKRKEVPQLRGPPPNHNEIRDMIRDIGLMKNFIVETECPINDMRLDVAWKLPVREKPDHAWEVHIGGNFFEALAKLKHAWDLWNADPYLVTTERSADEAKKLLGGTFHEIKSQLQIVQWQDIVRLYKLLTEVTEVERKLRL